MGKERVREIWGRGAARVQRVQRVQKVVVSPLRGDEYICRLSAAKTFTTALTRVEMHPYPRLRRYFHLKVKRLTTFCASLTLLHPLLSLTHWIFGALSLPYKSSSHSAKCVRCAPPAAAGCVEGGDGPVGPRVLRVLRFDSHFVAEGCGIALMGDEYICRHRRQARCARPPLVAGATTFATV